MAQLQVNKELRDVEGSRCDQFLSYNFPGDGYKENMKAVVKIAVVPM